jgi:hypothetical protein
MSIISERQRVYFYWLVWQRARQMLDECKTQADYTKVKDEVLRSARRHGMPVQMKSIPAMATDIVLWIMEEVAPSMKGRK